MKRFHKLIIGLTLITASLFGFVDLVTAAVDIAVETNNVTTAFNRLRVLGLDVRDAFEEVPVYEEQIIGGETVWVLTGETELQKVRIENRLGICNTPILEGVNGKFYFTFRVPLEKATHIPSNDTPNFAVLWRGDELCGEPDHLEICPWPMVEVQSYDVTGDPAGTHWQGVGVIN
jgi:hypothetical protein